MYLTNLKVTPSEWMYTIENNEATITEYVGSGSVITIPSQINGAPVTKIGNLTYAKSIFGSFWGPNGLVPNTTVASVTIPSTVTRIGAYSFIGLTSVANIAIPSSVKIIEDGAFQHMLSLKTIDMSYGLQTLGNGVFIDCPSLLEINIPDSVTTIGHTIFQLCTSLETVCLSESLASIRYSPFTQCPNLKSVFFRGNLPFTESSWLDTSAVVYSLESTVGWTKNFAGRPVYKIPNIFNRGQYDANRATGVNDVINSPNNFSLYTTSQMHAMAFGDLVLAKNANGSFVLNYDIEQSTDLQNWTTYRAYTLPLTGLPTDKAFVRVKMINSSPNPSPSTAAGSNMN